MDRSSAGRALVVDKRVGDTWLVTGESIKAITFDAAGTLVEPWPSVGTVYARVAEECGIGPVAAAELDRQFARAWKNKQGFDYSALAWRRVVEQTFAGLAHIKPAFFDHLYDEFAQPRCWRVYEDVGPALERCREKGLKLGVISNWDERLRPLLEQMGLAPYFDTILVSREVGHHKPAREIFERAAGNLQVTAGEIMHVGDSLEEDFQGARQAGFHAVLLDRRSASTSSIESLSVLLPC
jgi:putative hydrolase of the HAD superfamily